MQTKKEFTEELLKTVNSLMGDGYRAEIHYVEKINTGKQASLIILNSENCISPNFYIDELYNSYKNEKAGLDEIAKNIINIYYNNAGTFKESCNIKDCINDREWIEKRLVLQLINTSKNKELLKDSLYMDFKGLSLVLYVIVMENNEGLYKIRVTKTMCQQFGWNEREILHYALENTSTIFPYSLFPISELLKEAMNRSQVEKLDISYTEDKILILTNNRNTNGAAAVFYPSMLKEISRRYERSLFLLPSSIHEFIVLEDNGIYNPKYLEDIVKEVNRSAVEPEDVLSDSLYYYGFNSGILSVFHNGSFEKICSL